MIICEVISSLRIVFRNHRCHDISRRSVSNYAANVCVDLCGNVWRSCISQRTDGNYDQESSSTMIMYISLKHFYAICRDSSVSDSCRKIVYSSENFKKTFFSIREKGWVGAEVAAQDNPPPCRVVSVHKSSDSPGGRSWPRGEAIKTRRTIIGEKVDAARGVSDLRPHEA